MLHLARTKKKQTHDIWMSFCSAVGWNLHSMVTMTFTLTAFAATKRVDYFEQSSINTSACGLLSDTVWYCTLLETDSKVSGRLQWDACLKLFCIIFCLIPQLLSVVVFMLEQNMAKIWLLQHASMLRFTFLPSHWSMSGASSLCCVHVQMTNDSFLWKPRMHRHKCNDYITILKICALRYNLLLWHIKAKCVEVNQKNYF